MLINRNPHVSIVYMGIFFIVLMLLPHYSLATDRCAIMKQDSVALRAKTRKKKRVFQNEIFPFLGHSKNRVAIKTRIDGKAFWLLSKAVRLEQSALCNLSSSDDLSNKNQEAQLQPKDGVSESVLDDSHSKDSELEIKQPPQKQVVADSSKESTEVSQGWTYGIEAGYLVFNSKKPFENLITSPPPANLDVNNNDYNSPFVDSVSGGSGFDFSAFAEMPLIAGVRLKAQLGYMQRDLSYVYRINPHNPDVSFVLYKDLPISENSVTFQSVYLTIMPKIPFSLFTADMAFGFGLRGHYYLQEFVQERRTAPQKLTPYYVSSGYSSFEVELLPRIEVKFSPVYIYLQFTNQLTGASHFNMDPHIGVGLEF